MEERTAWTDTYAGKRGFWFVGMNLLIAFILTALSFVYFAGTGHWEIAIGLTVLFMIGIALGLRAVFFFWRNWCTQAAVTGDFLLVRCKDGSIRRIPWEDVSQIRIITTGSRFTGTVQAQIILTGERYDNAVVTGEAATVLYEAWMKRQGKLW
jgi:hypothetical protein